MIPQNEQLVLTLAVYGNSRHNMPTHQAAAIARAVVETAGGDERAEDMLKAFDDEFKRFVSGRQP
jgi:hypothetical protein